jgi:hypothetical protein
MLCPAPALAADPVSFRREVVPAFTAAGCNAGACHGSPTGKNGFRLSLRGYDPASDLATLTREFDGRRIDRTAPGNSLILQKTTGKSAHEGGIRLHVNEARYRLIRDWIAQGATDDKLARPTQLTVTPAHTERIGTTSPFALQVTATFADGTTKSVTHLTRFATTDEAVAKVTLANQVIRTGRGEAAVTAEYMGLMAVAGVRFLDPGPAVNLTGRPAANFIDRLVADKLQDLRVEPSPLCSDAEFVRRAALDATGRLPTPERIRAFLADTRPDKRDRFIDGLLASVEYADWWGMKWADRLGVNQRFTGKKGAVKYFAWVRAEVAANVPEDVLARRVLTAAGGNYSNPPAGFYRRLRNPQTRAEEISQLFLGVRIGCAKCHNHPGERWTQDDYYHLAAFFARVGYRDGPFYVETYDKEETVLVPRTGEAVQPRSGKVMPSKFLGGAVPEIGPEQDRREVFAAWLTRPDNPFFAKAAANRIWFHLFGRGIVEPVDDIRATNPPANGPLLDTLAAELVKSGFDRKHLIRLILQSRTYQASSTTTPANEWAGKYGAYYTVRRLGAEELYDAIADAAGSIEKFPGQPAGTPASRLPDGEYQHPFLTAFGRPARAIACECEREADTTLGQALHLSGGRTFDSLERKPGGRIDRLLAAGTSNDDVVNELFLATLCRLPTSEERAVAEKRLPAVGAAGRKAAVEDLLHALLNHPEFVFQH